MALIWLYLRRVRNRLFHGGKFNLRTANPDRSSVLLEHTVTILMAAIFASPHKAGSPVAEPY